MEGKGGPEITNGSSSAAASTVSGSATTFSDESEVRAREDTHLRSGFCQVTRQDDSNEYNPMDNSQSINDEPEEVRKHNSGNGYDPEKENFNDSLWFGIGNEHVTIDFDTDELMNITLLDDGFGIVPAPSTVHGLADIQPNFSYKMQFPDANLLGSHNPMDCEQEPLGFTFDKSVHMKGMIDDNMSAPNTVQGDMPLKQYVRRNKRKKERLTKTGGSKNKEEDNMSAPNTVQGDMPLKQYVRRNKRKRETLTNTEGSKNKEEGNMSAPNTVQGDMPLRQYVRRFKRRRETLSITEGSKTKEEVNDFAGKRGS